MHALPKLQQCARAFYQLNYDEERHLPPAPREQNEKGIEKERERERWREEERSECERVSQGVQRYVTQINNK